MAYQSNLMGDFWRGQRQRRLATGTSLTQNEMSGLLRPALDTEAAMAEAAARREQQQGQFNQQMDLRKSEVANQRMAGMVGGVTQMAMLPMAYGAAKNMGWIGGSTAPAAAGALTSSTAQGAVGAAGVGTGAQGALAGAADPGLAGGTAAPGVVGPMSAVEGAGGAGLLGAAGSAALPATAGVVGGNLLGQGIARMTGMHQKTAGQVGGVIGGAAAGAAYGSVVPGVGTMVGGVVGGIIGGISSLF